MNDRNISISLDCDDDVVLFEKDTFKVSRLKELTMREVRKKFNANIHDYKNNTGGRIYDQVFYEQSLSEKKA